MSTVATTVSDAAFAEVEVSYAPVIDPVTDESTYRLAVPVDGVRKPVRLTAHLTRPGVTRDALLALYDTLASDLRFRARNRADYLAYLVGQGKKVTQAVWDAQKEYLQLQYGEAQKTEAPLDPVVTVAMEGLRFEVFSRDESAYASLVLKAGAAYRAEDPAFGTTTLDFSPRLVRGLGRMRSYRESRLAFAAGAGTGAPSVLRVPYRWVRAFGQVQAASTLPLHSFELRPVDLYNVLLTLRLRRARTSPRALRYELVPGEVPRLILEPWDLVLEGGAPYQGPEPIVVRTFGRTRLAVLARLLPHAQSVHVHLVGPGLPAFYVVDLGDTVYTLGLSGWTDSGWAGIATFDLLSPGAVDAQLGQALVGELQTGPRTLPQLVELTSRSVEDVRQALLGELQRGQIGHDVATRSFFHRPLFAAPPPAERLRYRDAREEQAHRLLEVKGQVELTRVHDRAGEGTTIEGEVKDQQAHRSYRASFTLDREGRSTDAACTCPSFRRAGIKEGPCEHMMALRLAYARRQAELERARGTAAGRTLIRAETRTLIRRGPAGTVTYRVSLDDRTLVVRFGTAAKPRMQRLLFERAEEARDEYFARLAELARKGFIDASAAE
jgi:hypothetical protein